MPADRVDMVGTYPKQFFGYDRWDAPDCFVAFLYPAEREIRRQTQEIADATEWLKHNHGKE